MLNLHCFVLLVFNSALLSWLVHSGMWTCICKEVASYTHVSVKPCAHPPEPAQQTPLYSTTSRGKLQSSNNEYYVLCFEVNCGQTGPAANFPLFTVKMRIFCAAWVCSFVRGGPTSAGRVFFFNFWSTWWTIEKLADLSLYWLHVKLRRDSAETFLTYTLTADSYCDCEHGLFRAW